MSRAPLTWTVGSWPLAVVIATVAAAVAMTTTAGVSVLASDRVEAAGDLYGKPAPRRGGMRAVRAEPAPDATLVTFVPTITLLSEELRAMSRPVFWSLPVHPLHEADEVPESFI
ncbi:MAG TPA: hypothetical protein VEB22_14565 [Phycisphaerales bacterium]|nr:hypothetical protein [Phycisphaerales bacterium]